MVSSSATALILRKELRAYAHRASGNRLMALGPLGLLVLPRDRGCKANMRWRSSVADSWQTIGCCLPHLVDLQTSEEAEVLLRVTVSLPSLFRLRDWEWIYFAPYIYVCCEEFAEKPRLSPPEVSSARADHPVTTQHSRHIELQKSYFG